MIRLRKYGNTVFLLYQLYDSALNLLSISGSIPEVQLYDIYEY